MSRLSVAKDQTAIILHNRQAEEEIGMTRDDLIREYKEHSGTWPALVGVYALIVGAMVVSGYLMVG
ncbi:hypothetical protein CHH27_13945 [Labrenzia sp. VG12]|nr:hypothetical protein CHH27_13945 [Labrenzia sp. VG12]